MNQLHSKINIRSEDFKTNQTAMQSLVDDLKQKAEQIALGGGEAARQKHLARGKLLARDRIDQLIDAGTAFLEIGQLAAQNVYAGRCACGWCRCWCRSGQWCDLHDRRQRCDSKRRHVLPTDGEKTLTCSRNCGAKPSALYLFGGLRRCIFAYAG